VTSEVNNLHTKGQDFEVNFEVCIINFFSFVLLSLCFANVFMKFPVWLFFVIVGWSFVGNLLQCTFEGYWQVGIPFGASCFEIILTSHL
jgi:hypothetical protein